MWQSRKRGGYKGCDTLRKNKISPFSGQENRCIAAKMTTAYFLVIKPTRCTNFANLFCHETLHVSDSSSVHHQEFIHCTLSFRAGPGRNAVLVGFITKKCVTMHGHMNVKNSIFLREIGNDFCTDPASRCRRFCLL
jgi:hypothetical protein